MKKSSSTRYFLVFFKHGRNGRPESDVLHQKRIPDGYGSAAKVNDRVRIKYRDDDTKKFTFYDGVILQIDHDLNVLQTIDVDEKGEIVPPNQKRFPEELLAVKRHLAKQSRAITVAAKEHQRTLDTSLLGISVFNTASAPGCSGNLPQNGGTASQLQSDSRLVTPAGCSKDLSVNDVTASLLPSVSHLVTPEVKVFLEALVPAASSLHDSSQCAQVDWLHSVLQNILRSLESEQEKNVTLPEHFLKQSKQCDTDLFGNGKFFVPFMSYRAIHADVENKKGKKKNSWQIYVSEVLNRLYGNRMLYLTAKGQRRTTGIDGDLYNSLLDYCLHHFENFRSLENRVPAFNRNINVIRQGRKNMSKNRTAARENGAVVAKKQSKGNKKQSKGNQKQSKGNQKQSKGNQKQAKGKGSDSESDDGDEYEDISSESENHTGELRRTSSMDDEDLLDETPIREKLQQKCHGKRVVGENRQLLERKFLQPVLVGKRKISDGYLHSSTSEGPHIQSQATDFHQGFTKQMRPGQVISAAGQYNPYYQQAPHRVPHSYSHRGGSPVVSSGQGAQRLPHNYSPNQVSQLPAYYSHLPQEGSHVYDYAPTAGSPYVANSEGIQSVEQYSQDPMTIALQVVNNPNLI
ncbi:uncharacterized protein LOC113207321 [Frankliniella occidentalis]|uniref:Uncharacterized protein LOC113207321 n=1 Tax=Frankliniella occidentalis TaxID=133901 RepID=A0A9C6UBU7_FRAOC|nr:uncharacterized protein LOC113207321 [Frankliniella occidentalis]